MKIQLVDFWKQNLLRFWSNRLALLSALCQGAAAAIFVYSDKFTPLGFMIISMVLSVAAVAFRMIKQKKVLRKGDDNGESE